MQKIPTVFVRDKDNPKRVTDEVTEGCEWVFVGGVISTEKFDGSACLVRDGHLYKRHRKRGEDHLEGWLHWDFNLEATSGHGWLPVREGPEDKYHREAWEWLTRDMLPGPKVCETYELVGPNLQGNPHGLPGHQLWRHGRVRYAWSPDNPDSIPAFLEAERPMEGLVFYHPRNVGVMAKIKRRDYGLPWPVGPREE